jgi:hypothetical protein
MTTEDVMIKAVDTELAKINIDANGVSKDATEIIDTVLTLHRETMKAMPEYWLNPLLDHIALGWKETLVQRDIGFPKSRWQYSITLGVVKSPWF